jgi:amino acid transporter
MPPTFDEEDLWGIDTYVDSETRKTYTPPKKQKIQWFTVGLLIMNRTIGSGIFVSSANVFKYTQSPGLSIILWAVGGLLTLCIVLVWLEFGLSIPRKQVSGNTVECVPQSGGEKNYVSCWSHLKRYANHLKLEYALQRPKFLATCMYGIPFILLGNLAGNALAFARYAMLATGRTQGQLDDSPIIGIAIGASTVVILVHMSSRRGGIILNDVFAVFKILFLFSILAIGFAVLGGGIKVQNPIGSHNFHMDTSFSHASTSFASYTRSLLSVIYSFSGFEQPFYVSCLSSSI